MSSPSKWTNLLGDIRAEEDRKMLDQAFYQSRDYSTLSDASDISIVVGRRGTGKSALFYRLIGDTEKNSSVKLIAVTPEEDQIIGIRPLIGMFGNSFRLIKAGMRIIWQYSLLLEIASTLDGYYKSSKLSDDAKKIIADHLKPWRLIRSGMSSRLRQTLKTVIRPGVSSETNIGELKTNLHFDALEGAVRELISNTNKTCLVLIDRLDEGYEPDTTGIALISGIVQATIDINTKYKDIHPVLFVRDNIFRAIAQYDPDYSRNIEGKVLRLHWDEYELFNLVCSRLKVAFDLKIENNTKVWDRCTAGELQGRDGFKRCLQLTLYRPRDLLALINEAFYRAWRRSRKIDSSSVEIRLTKEDLDSTAKFISENRLDDLHKEYEVIVPGLARLTAAFADRNPVVSITEAQQLLAPILAATSDDPKSEQHFAILGSPFEAVKTLHGVGFLGIKDAATGAFVYCHDGRSIKSDLQIQDSALIHPCYWLALNISQTELDPNDATEIHDEYDIEVSSQTPEIRKARLGRMIESYRHINLDYEVATEFEDWCIQAIRIVFAAALRNFEWQPIMYGDVQQRCLVTTVNPRLSSVDPWKEISNTNRTHRLSIFIWNHDREFNRSDAQIVTARMKANNGKIALAITRHNQEVLHSGDELDAIVSTYASSGLVVIKLTGESLCKILSKLRNPQKHDYGSNILSGLINQYVRGYLKHAKVKPD